jgi:hypothetical protein
MPRAGHAGLGAPLAPGTPPRESRRSPCTPTLIHTNMSRAAHSLLLTLALLCCAASPLRAQAAEAEVRAVVDRLFDAMRSGDSTAVRAVFHPEARLQTVGAQSGTPVLRTEPIDAFVRAVGSPRAEVWDERIWDVEIQVDGDLAAAWMQYAFFVGERFSHCGVNAFQFFRAPEGWQVTQITDTRRRDGCPEPPGS